MIAVVQTMEPERFVYEPTAAERRAGRLVGDGPVTEPIPELDRYLEALHRLNRVLLDRALRDRPPSQLHWRGDPRS